jgi:molybdopterin molybdotransferase
VLADDVFTTIDTPPFDNSAVDGYAFSFADWDGNSALKVIGEIQAGSTHAEIGKGEAVRIFTGAAIPKATDTVIMQEKVEVVGNVLRLLDDQLTLGRNVRPKASQTKAGSLALPKGHCINPASISFLAGLGVETVDVFAKPKVKIIITGKELVRSGQPLEEGKIYESNGHGLGAALRSLYIEPASIALVGDEKLEIMSSIKSAEDADMIILTGGASVGDYDFVPAALTDCGATQIFHKVKQRPGKPFYFGTLGETLVFGLPGNPAAVLTCFYEFIVPAIETFTKRAYCVKKTCTLSNSFSKKPNLTYFLKGKTNGNQVEILDHQQSYKVNSFAYADCLVTLDEDRESYDVGDEVEVLIIV